jgi:hypothetical protein
MLSLTARGRRRNSTRIDVRPSGSTSSAPAPGVAGAPAAVDPATNRPTVNVAVNPAPAPPATGHPFALGGALGLAFGTAVGLALGTWAYEQ